MNKQDKVGRKRLFVRLTHWLNLICGLLMLADAIYRFVNFGTAAYSQGDPFFYLMTFYLCGFAALFFAAELRFTSVLVYCEFLRSRPGKGLYLVLLGLLLFDESRAMDLVTAIVLVLAGLFNILVSCMRDDPKPSKKRERRQREQMESQQEEYGAEDNGEVPLD
jgi:COPI associated protein